MSHRTPFRGRGRGRGYGRGRGRGRGRYHHSHFHQSSFTHSHSPNKSQIINQIGSYSNSHSQPPRGYNNAQNNMINNLNNSNNNSRYHYPYPMDQNASNIENNMNNNNNNSLALNQSGSLHNNSNETSNRYQYSYKSTLSNNNKYNSYYHTSHNQNINNNNNNNENNITHNNNDNNDALNIDDNECDLVHNDIKSCHQIIIQRGLPTDGKLNDYELYSWFTDCNGFIGIRWGKENRVTDHSHNVKYKNFAFADFATKEDANDAILRKNELCIDGNKLSLRIVNKELTITTEMRQIYHSVAVQFKKRQQTKERERDRHRDRDRERDRDRDRDRDRKRDRDRDRDRSRERERERDRDREKGIKIKIESDDELIIRQRRARIHNKLDDISSAIDKYEIKMKEKCNAMFLNDSNLSKLWRSGIEKYIESYKNVIKSDKQTYCKLFECYQKQQKYENQIARLQSQIDSIESQLFHLKNQ